MPDETTRRTYSIDDLQYLMARLREPETGCPWDLKQTFESIVPHTLEEAYEVADAIEQGDRQEIRDELGDLLFQVVFYARIAEEEGSFDFDDVADAITSKLLRRHPHVFPDQELRAYHEKGTRFTAEQIKGQWERIKAEERALKAQRVAQQSAQDVKQPSLLDNVPAVLPALGRAEKLQRRAASVGFDWDNVDDVFAKLEEEIGEIRAVIQEARNSTSDVAEIDDGQEQEKESVYARTDIHERLTDEVGDLLFCSVNLARFLKVNPDEALRACNAKFSRRFQFIEQALHAQGKPFAESSLSELDALWDQAKAAEKDVS